MHATIALTVERLAAGTGDMRAADLAYHFGQAGDWAKVFKYAPLAGERAQAVYAPRAAVEHFSHALEAARQLALPPPMTMVRQRAHAYELVGLFEEALSDYEAIRGDAAARGDDAAEWQSQVDLGSLWTARDYERAGDYFRRALDVAHVLNDPFKLAHSLNRVGNWHVNHDQPAEGQLYHQEALATFERHDDRHAVAETLDYLGTAHWFGGDLLGSSDYQARAATLFRELGDRQRYAYSLMNVALRGADYFSTASPWAEAGMAECLRDAEEALRIVRQTAPIVRPRLVVDPGFSKEGLHVLGITRAAWRKPICF